MKGLEKLGDFFFQKCDASSNSQQTVTTEETSPTNQLFVSYSLALLEGAGGGGEEPSIPGAAIKLT